MKFNWKYLLIILAGTFAELLPHLIETNVSIETLKSQSPNATGKPSSEGPFQSLAYRSRHRNESR